MTESVLVTLETKVIPENDPCLAGPRRPMRQSYQLENGSVIVVAGLDNADRIMSTEYDLIAVFEATEVAENDWEMLLTRLRNGRLSFQQLIADCNPHVPTHWLNQRANNGKATRFLSRHQDNPRLFDRATGEWTDEGKQYLATLDRLTGHRRERLLNGKWAAATGLVYEVFDRTIHTRPQFVIPREWRRIVSIDFGYTNPFSCSWYAIDGDGIMYRYRQIYFTKRTVRAHAKQIIELTGNEQIEAWIADHDAEDRATLEENGIHTMPAKKAPGIKAGIARVEARLAARPKPRLIFLEDSLVERDPELVDAKLPCCTEEEMDCYMWPHGQNGKTKKETPVDKDNHGCDDLRYAVMYADEGRPVIEKAPPIDSEFYTPSIANERW